MLEVRIRTSENEMACGLGMQDIILGTFSLQNDETLSLMWWEVFNVINKGLLVFLFKQVVFSRGILLNPEDKRRLLEL